MLPQDGLDMASDSSRLPLKITSLLFKITRNQLKIYYTFFRRTHEDSPARVVTRLS